MKTNKRVRLKMVEYGITQYGLSKILGMSEMTVYRRLRDELPEEEQNRIIALIEQTGGEA